LKTLTTYERRQTIVRILEEQSGIKVTELAETLGVSEGTVRNDLAALSEDNQITRVRGGAIARSTRASSAQFYVERVRENAAAKERIVQWAANMVEDGDTIMMDASTTVLRMIDFLHTRRNLTIITNGLETARRLAEMQGNTVIMLGGILGRDGTTITGLLGAGMLENLHVRTAFISCVGLSMDAGLTEADAAQAELKGAMVRTAQRVVALVDHSKFERVALRSFAALPQIDHLFTDSDVAMALIDQVRDAGVTVTVCSDNTTTTYTPEPLPAQRRRIGFANLSEDIPFGRDVRRGLEQAAQRHKQLELIIADNRLDGATALANADDFIAQGVDLMIEFQIDETIGSQLNYKFSQSGIPLIAVDIPIVGATFFGVDNYKTGFLAGAELGKAIRAQWGGQIDVLAVLEHPRAGSLTATRIQGQRAGVESVIGGVAQEKVISADCGNTSTVSEHQMERILESVPRGQRIAVICFNDDAACGSLGAARKAYRTQDVLIVGQGADRRLRDELRRGHSPIVGSTAFHPELYGERLIEIALRILNGEPVPPAVYIDHTFISADNVDLYYPNDNGRR
jgi:ribose transport system substrate-binding protein